MKSEKFQNYVIKYNYFIQGLGEGERKATAQLK